MTENYFNADKVTNLQNWKNYELMVTNGKTINRWMNQGAIDIMPEELKELFFEYEQNCSDFLKGMIKAYNDSAATPLNEEAESLSWDSNFSANIHLMSIHPAPFILRQFALNTLNNQLNISLLQKFLEG